MLVVLLLLRSSIEDCCNGVIMHVPFAGGPAGGGGDYTGGRTAAGGSTGYGHGSSADTVSPVGDTSNINKAGNEGVGNTTDFGFGSGNSGRNAKGSEYDATGGSVDDRSLTQKATDAVKPGSQVGSHTK